MLYEIDLLRHKYTKINIKYFYNIALIIQDIFSYEIVIKMKLLANFKVSKVQSH